MKTILTVLCLFLSASFLALDSVWAQQRCENVFSNSSSGGLDYELHKSEFNGTEFYYTQFQPKYYYEISKDLPQLENSFLIHFSANGHVMIWYRNVRLDGLGMPFFGIHGDKDHAEAIRSGVAFVIHKLPEGFDRKFSDFIDDFKSKLTLTCVSNACGTLQQLGLREESPKKFLSATGFYNHLIKLSVRSQGNVEVVSLGKDINEFPTEMSQSQKQFVKNGLIMALIGTAIPTAVGSLYFIH